jgi:predicted dehydrogenase
VALVRVAVVGTGYWGLSHVRTFAAEPTASLTWICDRDPSALQRATAIAPTARTTDRFEDVLDAADVDAVVLATPATTHAELTIRCVERGRHVLVEKPLALSVADGERVVAAAARSSATVLIGHLMLYHPAVEYLRYIL